MSHIAAALAKSKGKNVPSPSTPGVTGGAGGLPALRIGPQTTPVLIKPGAVAVAPLAVAGSAAPFKTQEEPVSSIVAPPEPPKRAMFFTVVVLVAAILGVSGWLLLKKDNLFANLRLLKPSATAAAPAASATTTAPTAAPAAGAVPQKANPANVAAVEHKPVNQALVDKVRTLPITAAAGGASQRLSVSGKVFEPGEMVVEGLILQSIETEEIVFRDTEGNLYTRRL